ncbi:MAG: hypothetical protein P0S95_01135 [Rhabdochlamydiaceae bacterium]|nr:hypothetical protein [Candidatus Amphrikana amoebophyrae]
MKSEKLKKLENELADLQQWKKLGLVPKKDLEKHEKEIGAITLKIEEENERLLYLKENGDQEEYTMPKRSPQTKQAYQEPNSMPDIESTESDMADAGLDLESESYDAESSSVFDMEEGSEERTIVEDEDENPFSDRNRWKRGILDDPDSNDW